VTLLPVVLYCQQVHHPLVMAETRLLRAVLAHCPVVPFPCHQLRHQEAQAVKFQSLLERRLSLLVPFLCHRVMRTLNPDLLLFELVLVLLDLAATLPSPGAPPVLDNLDRFRSKVLHEAAALLAYKSLPDLVPHRLAVATFPLPLDLSWLAPAARSRFVLAVQPMKLVPFCYNPDTALRQAAVRSPSVVAVAPPRLAVI
jgi:hypothetical protein